MEKHTCPLGTPSRRSAIHSPSLQDAATIGIHEGCLYWDALSKPLPSEWQTNFLSTTPLRRFIFKGRDLRTSSNPSDNLPLQLWHNVPMATPAKSLPTKPLLTTLHLNLENIESGVPLATMSTFAESSGIPLKDLYDV